MRSFRASLALLLTAALITIPAFATPTHKRTASGRSASSKSARYASGSKSRSGTRKNAKLKGRKKLRGQQGIDAARASEIQQALIREHYLNGEPTGQWDASTVAAMQKFQSDQGWQTKLTPDSRALKKLGLGPDYSGAINASGSSFAAPRPASAIPTEQAEGFAEASGVKQ